MFLSPREGNCMSALLLTAEKLPRLPTACLMAGYEIIPLFEHQLKKAIYMALLNGPDYESEYYMFVYYK